VTTTFESTNTHHVGQVPPPVEWSSDHTARTITQLAADTATIKKWVTFFGICFILWLAASALIVLSMLSAIGNATS
jgi:hypothetical protein